MSSLWRIFLRVFFPGVFFCSNFGCVLSSHAFPSFLPNLPPTTKIFSLDPSPPPTVQQAYVITFGRAGEDNKKFKLGDVERTLEGFAGADYNLQDALTAATDKKAQKREGSEQEFYDYEVAGPDFTYLAAVTLNGGKVFALFVSSPTKSFKSDEAALRHIVESFKTI